LNPSNLIQEKKLVICLKCGHEFRTKVSSPRCSKCGSRKISDIKKAGKKEVQLLHIQIRDLEGDLQRHKETMAEEFKSIGYDMKSLYRYLEQIAAVLKENKLIPEPREEMVSPIEKKKRLCRKNNISKVIKKKSTE
jgi:DNA-directed RNA polymerase subunit RPC12/RpoP